MKNDFQMDWDIRQVNTLSVLGLAHLGDGVYELLCRSYLCRNGDKKAGRLHQDTVKLVRAAAQARFAEAILSHLTEEEQDFYRRGKNAHTHAAPKGATPQEYARATGLEALFGALYLMGQTQRLSELFAIGMEANYGL